MTNAELFFRMAIDALIDKLKKLRLLPLTPEEKIALRRFKHKANCRHLKGGYMRQAGKGGRWFWDIFEGPTNPDTGAEQRGKDYNVQDFTLPTNERFIKCLNCRREWRPGEDGWDDAVKMTKQSTNRPASSERSAKLPMRKKVGHNDRTRI
jgi:hypothetical protein